MADLVSFPGKFTPFSVQVPDEDLIAWLEETLIAAREGQIRSIAYVAVHRDRNIHHGWHGHCDAHDLVAGMALLQHRGLTDIMRDDE